MRKIGLFILMLLPAIFTSCYDKNEVEYTGAGDLCGQWIVIDSITHTEFVLTTSNTSANDNDKLYISDFSLGKPGFWAIQAIVSANKNEMTFGQDSVINMVLQDEVVDKVDHNGDGKKNMVVPYDIKLNIRKGKITKNAVSMPSGVKTDKIYLEFQFEDDSYTTYKVQGYRKTGFHEDDSFVLSW